MERLIYHHHRLICYCVDADRKEVRMRTAYDSEDEERHEETDITFSGVVAYHFENDNLWTILYDIEEAGPELVLADHGSLFERSREWGWPGRWNTSAEAALAHLRGAGVRSYLLSSSSGLRGWVLAQTMTQAARRAV